MKDVIREKRPERSNILKAMIKLEARRTAMMIHQPHTGRKAATHSRLPIHW